MIELLRKRRSIRKFTADKVSPEARQTLIEAAKKTQSDPELMALLYEKGRLPITKIAESFLMSVKTLKTYKYYIIAVILVIENDLVSIKEWISIN